MLWARQFGSPENQTADGAYGIAANSSAVYVGGQIAFAAGDIKAAVEKAQWEQLLEMRILMKKLMLGLQ